jgi:DNA polymerase I-like protein with 3'-5' exonuclease and polymerase domains
MSPNPITIDFETEAINGNPILTPPHPVGVAVWVPDQEPVYLSWGHSDGNNCSFEDAHEYLRRIRDSNEPILFHYAGFDLSVWDAAFCNARWSWLNESWRRVHDTMYLLFLADPYSSTLSLKPSADRYLGMAATEQTELYDWIVANLGVARKEAGAYISKAPGALVGRYAVGDVVRTRKLFDLLYAKIDGDGMLGAYQREQRLFPITLAGTKRGIRVDRARLQEDEHDLTRAVEESGIRLAGLLSCDVTDLDHGNTLADALETSGSVSEWVLTPKSGKRSMSRDNLKIQIPAVKELMDYRGVLHTSLHTFIRPWIEFSAADGRLHPNWNQVKQARREGSNDQKGTRTGRLSSDSPNFQNVPSEFTDDLGAPLIVPTGLPSLPIMRSYCLPEIGHVWCKRDFSSQEIRILAHFEDGSLCEAYKFNPDLDPHQMARELITSLIGVTYARKDIKITGFSIIYGTGANGLSRQLGRPISEAASIKFAYLAAMPGVKELMQGVQSRGKSNQPIRTWGGRIYYAEPAKVIDGRLRDFAYKLLNYLIQGSAADQTKESINDWDDHRKWDSIFLATVHDEINISVPEDAWQEHMSTLKTAMNADRFDVPMTSEGFVGKNWSDIENEATYKNP